MPQWPAWDDKYKINRYKINIVCKSNNDFGKKFLSYRIPSIPISNNIKHL